MQLSISLNKIILGYQIYKNLNKTSDINYNLKKCFFCYCMVTVYVLYNTFFDVAYMQWIRSLTRFSLTHTNKNIFVFLKVWSAKKCQREDVRVLIVQRKYFICLAWIRKYDMKPVMNNNKLIEMVNKLFKSKVIVLNHQILLLNALSSKLKLEPSTI